MSGTHKVSAEALQALCEALFTASDVSAEHARSWAEVLVWANLRGVESHGVLRIPRYLELIQLGQLHARPNMRWLQRAGAIALLDADRAPGPVAMQAAMDEAIARAREVHVGWVVTKDITHAGAVGHFALRAAKQGMAGLVMTASIPLMAWPGSKGAVLSTNPIAIAMPAEGRAPLLLDMASSQVSNGKIMAARDAAAPIPTGWGVDKEGADTTDAGKVATLLPLGGPKGAGLSLMIECLASLAAMNPVIGPALRGELAKGDTRMNGVAIALDLAAFGDGATIRREVSALAGTIKAQPRAPGAEELLMPGERGDAVKAKRLRDGIPIAKGTWDRLAEVAAARGVAMPAPL
jgi:ureidoglycolate dehydrogenase (NAD+)